MSISAVGNSLATYARHFANDVAGPVKRLENIFKLLTPALDAMVKLGEFDSLRSAHTYSVTIKESFNFPTWVTLAYDVLNVNGTNSPSKRVSRLFLLMGKTMQCFNTAFAANMMKSFIIKAGDPTANIGRYRLFNVIRRERNWMGLEGSFMITGLTMGSIIKIRDKNAPIVGKAISVTYNVAKISVITTKKFGLISKQFMNRSYVLHGLCIATGLLGVSQDIYEIYQAKKAAKAA